MSNYRLDYIDKFKPGTVEKMTELRAKYIELEKEIGRAKEELKDGMNYDCVEHIYRTYYESLTHLETSQMYAIKMLCLLGEDRR